MSASFFRVQQHALPVSHIREYPRALVHDGDELHIAIKQYTPLDSRSPEKGDVTVIGGHANGFPKELYEPLWDELYSRLTAKGIHIRSIWIADVAQQGASGVMNERKLGNDPSWADHSRDLFLMVNHFRHLIKRPLVGIGHSMGGCQLVNLSLMHPRLFTTLILIDPVIQRVQDVLGNFGPAGASTVRRDRWPNRNTAAASFKRSKFYQTWDPRVLDLWIKHGLRELPTHLYQEATAASATPPILTADPSTATVHPEKHSEKEVTLATTKHQEVMTFLRPNFAPDGTESDPETHPDIDPYAAPNSPFYNSLPISIFQRLPHVRPSVLYLFGDQSYLSAPLLIADKLATTGTGVGGSGGVKRGRVKQITFKGIGHLIPMEIVDKTADACADWMASEIDRWRSQEEKERAEWAKLPKDQKGKLSELYIKTMTTEGARLVKAEQPEKSKL